MNVYSLLLLCLQAETFMVQQTPYRIMIESRMYVRMYVCVYTECNRRNGPNFGRVFLMWNYTEKTQNTYTQCWTVWEIMASEVWNFDSYNTITDYQIHIETGRNMWFL